MGKILIRPLTLFLPILLGTLLQYCCHWNWHCAGINLATLTIRCALMTMFFFLALQLDFSRLRPRPLHGKLLCANALIGILPAWGFHLAGRNDLALVCFFTGMTPTANAAPVIMQFLNGRAEFVLTGFVLTNLGMDLLFILLLPLHTGHWDFSFAFSVLKQMLYLIAVPAGTAWILRSIRPSLRSLPKKLKTVSLLLWSATLFVVASTASEYVFQARCGLLQVAEAAGLSLALCALNFYAGGRLAPRKLRREASQTLGQKNTSLTIFLALTFGGAQGAFAALGPGFYVLWHNGYNALQMFEYDRRKRMSRLRRGTGRSPS